MVVLASIASEPAMGVGSAVCRMAEGAWRVKDGLIRSAITSLGSADQGPAEYGGPYWLLEFRRKARSPKSQVRYESMRLRALRFGVALYKKLIYLRLECWDMVAAIYRDHSYHSHHTASLNNSEVVGCWWVSTLIASDSLRNSRAGSRTIYQHGADVNVLFERRVAYW
jgi:hypothetical protein